MAYDMVIPGNDRRDAEVDVTSFPVDLVPQLVVRTARVRGAERPLPLMRTEYAKRIAEWEAWDDVSRQAFG